jgi:transcription elongation factor Elf1
MKTCSRCKLEKPISEFNKKRASGVQPYCRPCQGEYQRENYENVRVQTLENIYENRHKRKMTIRLFLAEFYQNHPCVDCGETDITVLDFDHLLEKNFGLNKAISNVMPIERIKEELKHGEVRCSNCHRKITAERTRNWRWRYKNGFSIEQLDYDEEYKEDL